MANFTDIFIKRPVLATVVSLFILILGITKYSYEFYTRIIPADKLIQPEVSTIKPLEKINCILLQLFLHLFYYNSLSLFCQ